jgi:hypothetical protein
MGNPARFELVRSRSAVGLLELRFVPADARLAASAEANFVFMGLQINSAPTCPGNSTLSLQSPT